MNCSSLSIETPEKVFIREKEKTPLKLNIDPEKRFSPSETMRSCLKQMERIHKFEFHEEFEFRDLTELNITQKVVGEISRFIAVEEPDATDLVLRIEELAVQNGKFDNFLKLYVAEEFQVDPSYSFLILCVLNYMDRYNVELNMAASELLTLSSRDSICDLCIDGEIDNVDKLRFSQIHNLGICANVVGANLGTNMEDLSVMIL